MLLDYKNWVKLNEQADWNQHLIRVTAQWDSEGQVMQDRF